MTVQEYLQPASLSEAVGLLAEHGTSLTVIGGGTLVMPLVNDGVLFPERVMSLRGAGISGIERREDDLLIGAATTLTEIAEQDSVPMLAEAARNTASWSVRNMATIGGNLFAAPHGGDVAVALLALDADVRLAGPSAERVVPLSAFYAGSGTACAADELVVAIRVPLSANRTTAYERFARKHGNTPAVVSVAAAIEREEGTRGRVSAARIALGAAGPHPLRAAAAEAAIVGSTLEPSAIARAAEAAARECEPPTDAIATEWYRRRMVGVFVRRALEAVATSTAVSGGS